MWRCAAIVLLGFAALGLAALGGASAHPATAEDPPGNIRPTMPPPDIGHPPTLTQLPSAATAASGCRRGLHDGR